MASTRRITSKAQNTEEVAVVEEPKVQTTGASLTLEQYAQRAKVNPGTIASFKYEAQKAGDNLQPRGKDEWKQAIEAQQKRVY